MLKTFASGRMYNGTVHEYKDKNNRNTTRTMFRGRLNYRNPDGSYSWIDAVCFRDNPNSDSNGTVGFLEDNYISHDDGDIAHGRAIEVFGTIRETKKRMTVEVKVRGGGIKEIPNVEHDSFEIIIDEASFVPTNQSDKDHHNEVDLEEEDEFEFDGGEEGDLEEDPDFDDEEPEIEEEPAPAPKPSRRSGNKTPASNGSSARSGGKSQGSNRPASGARASGGSSRAANRQAPAPTGNRNRSTSGAKSSSRKGKEDNKFFRD